MRSEPSCMGQVPSRKAPVSCLEETMWGHSQKGLLVEKLAILSAGCLTLAFSPFKQSTASVGCEAGACSIVMRFPGYTARR